MGWNVFRKGMMAVGVVLVLGACGVKSSPRVPEGSAYPRAYPYAGPERESALPPASPSSATSSPVAPDETRESDRGQQSPLGFPLEYPNRPSYN